MMPKRSGLNILIELAERSCDAAAALLAKALENERKDREKLCILQNYRNEYVGQFQANQIGGISLDNFRNCQQFLHKLEVVLKRQEAQVEADVMAVLSAQKMWQETRRKLKTYGVLEKRNNIGAQQKILRIEQKLNDEFSNQRRGKEIKP